eukprot:scaffold93295_cov30-Tisochrysis_lutea.AAC.1
MRQIVDKVNPQCPHNPAQRQEREECHTIAYGPWCPYFARMLRNQRITASFHFQDTRHIELDLGDSGLTYEPVLPRTPPAAVDALLKRLSLDGSQHVCVEPAEHNAATAAAAAAGQPVVAFGTVRALVQVRATVCVGTWGSYRPPCPQMLEHISSNTCSLSDANSATGKCGYGQS